MRRELELGLSPFLFVAHRQGGDTYLIRFEALLRKEGVPALRGTIGA
jgi:hypothetical protein